jgi:pantoate--beta-alanine ligase
MIIFKHIRDIQPYLQTQQNKGLTTGFAPTMGALHQGHISLVDKAKKECDFVVSSIFVNPTQFNDPKDFEKYPITLDKDIYLLEKAGCDVLFLPAVTEMYPGGLQSSKKYELGYLETVLDGAFRPGHFQGVCQVVEKLLNIVHPDKLFLGQKDYQQCMVIKKLVELTGTNTSIIVSPTQREPDGLAMSSRNARLTQADRDRAPLIYKTLQIIKEQIKPGDIRELKSTAMKILTAENFKVDYFEIAAADSLELLDYWDGTTHLVALAAAFIGEVRLIDNLLLQ